MEIKGILLRADVADRQGHIFPREVLEKAVKEVQNGPQIPALEGFRDNLESAQGVVTSIGMVDEGIEVTVDVYDDTEAGRRVKKLLDPAIASAGLVGKREGNIIRDYKLECVAIVERKQKIE